MKILLALGLAVMSPAFAAESPRVAELNPLASINLDTLSETRDRPLFSPSRRPPAPIDVAAPAVLVATQDKTSVKEPPPFDLIGVILGGDAPMVLLAGHGGAGVSRLRLGDLQSGWRVAEINIRSVVLSFGDRQESLALSAPVPPAAEATPAQVADRQTTEGAMTPGPVRDEYRRLMRQLAVKR